MAWRPFLKRAARRERAGTSPATGPLPAAVPGADPVRELLDQLANHTPVEVAAVADHGTRVEADLRHGSAAGTLVCRRGTRLRPGAVVLVHDGGAVQIPGTDPAELAGNLWTVLGQRTGQRTRPEPTDPP